jgi:hypothetical protein
VSRTRPPSGQAPPPRYADHAVEVCRRYGAEFPDEGERYGDAWMPWCRHDTQYVMDWAAQDLAGLQDLDAQLDWLRRILAAREFPVGRMARHVALCAEVARERGEVELADRLAAASGRLAAR